MQGSVAEDAEPTFSHGCGSLTGTSASGGSRLRRLDINDMIPETALPQA